MLLPATSFFEHFDINPSYFHQYLSINEKAIEPLGEAKSNSDLFRALASAMRLSAKELYEDDERVARTLMQKSRAVDGTFEDLKKKGIVKLKVPNRLTFSTPSRKIELYSAAAASEGLGGLPAHVDVQRRLPYMLLTPMHKLLSRSQYHLQRPEITPVVYMNIKDFAEENLDAGGTVTLANEFGDWTVKVESSNAVPKGVILTYSALWPKLGDGKNANFLTTDFVQKYGGNSAYHSTFVRIG
jgi:anaerobic selenocysteine-containing dehydrogenase